MPKIPAYKPYYQREKRELAEGYEPQTSEKDFSDLSKTQTGSLVDKDYTDKEKDSRKNTLDRGLDFDKPEKVKEGVSSAWPDYKVPQDMEAKKKGILAMHKQSVKHVQAYGDEFYKTNLEIAILFEVSKDFVRKIRREYELEPDKKQEPKHHLKGGKGKPRKRKGSKYAQEKEALEKGKATTPPNQLRVILRKSQIKA